MKYLRTEYEIIPKVFAGECYFFVTRYEVWKGWFKEYKRNYEHIESLSGDPLSREGARKTVELHKLQVIEDNKKREVAWSILFREGSEIIQ